MLLKHMQESIIFWESVLGSWHFVFPSIAQGSLVVKHILLHELSRGEIHDSKKALGYKYGKFNEQSN